MKKILLSIAILLSVNFAFAQNRFESMASFPSAEIPLNDTLYSCKMNVIILDTHGTIPNFSVDTTVVSTNFQTGFQVDADRNKAVIELTERVNK